MDLKELIKLRQEQMSMSNEKFANVVGLVGSTVWRWYEGNTISLSARMKLIEYFAALNDYEMIGALLAYQCGRELTTEQHVELGRVFLDNGAK